MNFKKNDLLRLTLTDTNNLGFGVGHSDGVTVFVSGGVGGDTVECRIIKVNSTYAVARCEKILVPSPHRTDGRCHTAHCRGCAYRDIDYDEELRIKERTVRENFRKAGLPEVSVLPVVTNGRTCGYRNKAQYPIGLTKDGDYVIGFYAPKSHRVTEAADCPAAPEIFGRINSLLRDFFRRKRISVYDEESGHGLLRHIYLRRGEVSREVLLTLVINGVSLPYADDLAEELRRGFPEIVGFLLNENRENTNVVLGKKYITVYGRDYITDTLAGVRLTLSPAAFYQVNHGMAELLYEKALALAEPKGDEELLDLFCGAGSIGLSMAHAVRRVTGIEIVPEAVECAKKNAHDNGIDNAAFYLGDAADTASLLFAAEAERGEPIRPGICVIDPPRAGCDEGLVNFLGTLSPERIIYISCNTATLARDVARLAGYGYTPGDVTPFDLFPGTGHCEAVVRLTRSAK